MSEVRHIKLDYGQYGRTERITVPLFASEREGLHVGCEVVVDADDSLPSRPARVTRMQGREVELTFQR